MVPEACLCISRRQFLTAGGLTVAAACFAPSYLCKIGDELCR